MWHKREKKRWWDKPARLRHFSTINASININTSIITIATTNVDATQQKTPPNCRAIKAQQAVSNLRAIRHTVVQTQHAASARGQKGE